MHADDRTQILHREVGLNVQITELHREVGAQCSDNSTAPRGWAQCSDNSTAVMFTGLHWMSVLFMGQADVWNVLLHDLLNINIEFIGYDGLAVKPVHVFNACLLGTGGMSRLEHSFLWS